MAATHRMLVLLAVGGLIALAGGILRIACVGRSCEKPETAASQVPFCGLPGKVRAEVSAGFREGRSPNVLAVSRRAEVTGGTAFSPAEPQPPWPSSAGRTEPQPLVFHGTGVTAGAHDAVVTLDRVAPTLATIIGLEREHPEVRSGTAIEGVASGERPRLAVLVALKTAVDENNTMPTLQRWSQEGASFRATPGSTPLDPAAILTTLGTGGLPKQHGITGTLLRTDTGDLTKAWGRRAPISVIATLADDLDKSTGQRARIGLIGATAADRGLIGGNWYIGNDRDDISLYARPAAAAREAGRLLQTGYGTDDTPDLLAVALAGAPSELDASLAAIAQAADEASGGSFVIVVAGADAASLEAGGLTAADVESLVERSAGADVVEATAPGGLFIDQQVLADEGITEDEILRALSSVRNEDGSRVFDDVFTAIAVTFERYC